ncbi:MAG: peptidoglycan-binding protein [Sphingomonas paucimobilis]
MTARDRFQKIVGKTSFRPLDPWERALAHSVFRGSIPYDHVFLTDFGLGGAVTLCHLSPGSPALYAISWKAGLLTTRAPADQPATLIHELTHVWQGENGVAPGLYMLQSVLAQGVSGIRDWLRGGEWKGWDHHRGATYRFTANDIGRPWRDFNVEQQASIVQSWFMNERDRIVRVGPRVSRTTDFGDGVFGGGRSIHDARFPYIRDVIRARNRHADYRMADPVKGADAQIRQIQEKLAALGYLESRHVDGTVGRSRSATLDAVAAFQRRNGLKVDRDLGGPNSLTRRKLGQPISTLARWQ